MASLSQNAWRTLHNDQMRIYRWYHASQNDKDNLAGSPVLQRLLGGPALQDDRVYPGMRNPRYCHHGSVLNSCAKNTYLPFHPFLPLVQGDPLFLSVQVVPQGPQILVNLSILCLPESRQAARWNGIASSKRWKLENICWFNTLSPLCPASPFSPR